MCFLQNTKRIHSTQLFTICSNIHQSTAAPLMSPAGAVCRQSGYISVSVFYTRSIRTVNNRIPHILFKFRKKTDHIDLHINTPEPKTIKMLTTHPYAHICVCVCARAFPVLSISSGKPKFSTMVCDTRHGFEYRLK